MREAVCFVLIYVFVNTAETVKPKSVNLALETVLQFDKKDHSADVEVLDRVQNFLDNIKNVMTSSKKAKRRSNDDDLKFTEFLLEATDILKKYDDNDLEDFFAVLDDQSRKYNYKGCKFYELVDNHDVRRFMSNKLEQAKDTSAKTMRRYLSDLAKTISSDRFDGKHRGIISLVNSLYDGASGKFGKVVKNLRSYHTREKDSTLNLDDIISSALRTLVFDHYTNLNDNARQQLKTAVGSFWLSNQFNGGNSDHYAHDNDNIEVQDYKSKLRVIDVPNKFSQKNGDKSKIKSSRHKKDKRHKTKKITSKIDIDFINFKKTTREQPVTVSDEDSTKRNEKQYGVTQSLIDEDIMSNSYELKKPTTIEQSYKAILPTKPSSDDESDNGTDSEKSSSGISKAKKGISIEFANEKYISEQKKKHKKQKIGHITYDVERRLKFKAHDYTDEDGSDKDSVTDENAESSKEATNPKIPENEDLDESGLLIGGQNVQHLRYRGEQRTPKPSKRKSKAEVEEHEVVTELTKFTKKLKDRQKSQHKSRTKDRKKTTTTSDAKEQSTSKAIDTKDNKDSAFTSSDEGITIETFENEKEIKNGKKYSNLRKALKPTTGSVRKLIKNLQKQLDDVKQRMKLVTVGKANETDGHAETDSRYEKSSSKINDTEEKAQTDAKAQVSDKKDKANEIRASGDSGSPSSTGTEATQTTTTKSDTSYTNTTVIYETDSQTKPNRTTMQETNESTDKPIFRRGDDTDKEKSRESEENDNVSLSVSKDNNITEADKIWKSSIIDVLNETTTMSTITDSIFKTSAENFPTTLESDDRKTENDSVTSTNVPEEGKTKILDKKEEKATVQMRSTVIDLTKHLEGSNTVVVNMKENIEKKMVESAEKREGMRNLSEEMDLPRPPSFKDGKLEDPFNDIDVNLDFK